MNQTQIPSIGLMKQDVKLSFLGEQIRSSFGPSKEPSTLDEQLKRLSEQELNHLLSIAKMVKIAHGFGSNRTRSYVDLIRDMYPQFSSSKRSILGSILQDADPIKNTALTPVKSLLDYTNAALDEWTRVVAAPEPAPAQRLTQQTAKPNKVATTGPYKDKAAFIEAITPAAEAAVSNSGFMRRLAQSESSGDSNAEITIKDGRRFVGSLQFGAARLSNYKRHSGKTFTQDEFKADAALQDEVADWHIADIDKAIDALGNKAQGYDRDGLRSVAHLGGKGGMRQFVKSKGQYNPSDELGTSLQSYYDKFSS